MFHEYYKILSGSVSLTQTLMVENELISETLGFKSTLTQLIARKDFIQ